ncbi:MAG: MFS transporter [Thermoleophilia bacterium]|nr:MFS transporter [Thermoleophilia bacterium]
MTDHAAAAADGDAPTPLTITSRQRVLILVGTLIGMLVAAVSQTIVTTVLPSIAKDLNGFDLMTWVFTGAMLANAISTPLFGKLSDLYGRRRLYILGVSTFVAGTLVCALAGDMTVLIVGRVVQGVGMGAIIPLAMAIIADVVPANERGKWQGIMGAVFGLATVLGPLMGGWINDAFGWRWTFWMVLPLGAVALALIITQMHIPFHPRRAKIDWLGALTFGLGLSALLLALSEGGRDHPWDSARILGLFAAAAIALVAFVLVELRASEPLIPMHLFRDRNVWTTTVASFAIGGGMYVGVYFVPQFMQTVAGLSSSDSGEALVPLMLGLIITSVGSGIAVSRTGRYRGMIIAGPVIGALGLWLLAQLGPDSTILDTAWRCAVLGGGLGLVMQNVMLVAQNAVEFRFTGVVTSLLTLARTLGGTVCVAILGTVFATRLADDLQDEFARVPAADAGAIASVDSDSILSAGKGLPASVQDAIRSAAAETLTHVFLISIPFLVLALVAALLVRRDELSTESAISVVDELEHELADMVPTDPDHAPTHPH